MILVVDGYNLLKLLHGPDVSETKRSAFINMLGRYLKKRNHKVIVVFDAGPCTYPLQEKQKGVQIVFSGVHQSADEWIIRFSQEHKNKELVIISADRALLQQSTQQGAESLEPLIFYQKVKEVCEGEDRSPVNDASVVKFSGNTDKNDYSSSDNIDEIMLLAAQMPIPEKDERYDFLGKRSAGSKDVSKKMKKRRKLVDKL